MAKKRANGEGTIRRREDRNGWEARYYDAKGNRHSVYGKTQAEVRKRLAEASKEEEEDSDLDEVDLTVGQWLAIWQRDFLGNVKPGTALNYESVIRVHILPVIGEIKLTALRTPVVQRMYNQELAKGLSAKSIKNIHGCLHRALDIAVRIGYLTKNPTSACILPTVRQAEMQPLDTPDLKKLLEAIHGEEYEAIITTALFTGMRSGELLGLTWDCIDFKRGRLVVRRQLVRDRCKGGEYHFSTPKNGKIRVIVLAPSVVQLFREQQKRQALMMMDAGKKWVDNDLIFSNQTGGYLSYRTVYDCFKRVMTKLGLPETRFHDLRHTYAVAAIKSGDDIKTVQENLGHATAAFTLDVYGHVTNQMKEASASRMELFISTVSS